MRPTLAAMLRGASEAAAKTPTRASPRREHTKEWADGVRTQHAQGATIAALAREHGVTRDCIAGVVEGRYYVAPDRPKHAPIKRSVTWFFPAIRMPDSDIECMVATTDDEVFPAFHDGEQWRDLSAMPLADGVVLMWSEYPDHPKPKKGRAA